MDKAQGMAEFMFSDILGNHMLNFQISSAIDIDETDFILHYNNFKNRMNWSTQAYNIIYPLNLYFHAVGMLGWFIVAMFWNDRALLIINSVSCALLIDGLVSYYVKY